MALFNARQPRNQRPIIKDAYTDSIKKKMSYGFIPFVLGAIVLVFGMGQGVADKNMRMMMAIAGLVLFAVGLLIIIKFAKDLKDYANQYVAKEAQEQKVEKEVHKKVTWAEAIDEYKVEAKAAAVEASRKMAEQIAKAEAEQRAKAEAENAKNSEVE